MNSLSVLFVSSPESALFWVLSVTFLLIGGLVAATPFLMPKDECFAVSVPDSAVNDPYLRELKRIFALAVTAMAVVLLAACGCVFTSAGIQAFTGAYLAAVLALCLLPYILMLRFRVLVKRHKSSMGWVATGQERVAFIGEDSAPRAISLKWDLLMVVLAAITAAIGAAVYPLMPERIALQVGMDGTVDSWADKSPAVMAFPVLYVLFIAATFTFSHWAIVRSKKTSNPAAPASTAWAYGMFARAQSIFLVVAGVLLSLIGPLMELTFAGFLSLQQVAVPLLIIAMIVVLGAVVMSVVYGQNGSRLVARVQDDVPLRADDDHCWKGGIFYVNQNDPSLFVPERFGIGWTMNFGQPKAWCVLAGLCALVLAFLAISMTLAG